MPYTADQSQLYSLIERALDTGEIKDSLKKIPVDRETLRKSAVKNASQIWEAAAKEIAEYNLLEMRIKKLETTAPTFLKPLVYIYRLLRSVFTFRGNVDSGIREELKVAKSNAEEALIQFGILPQLRGIINEAFWRKSYGKQKNEQDNSRSL